MLEYMLIKQNHDFHKFELPTTYDFEQNLYFKSKRLEDLKVMAQDMVY
jgi:hypothetical protein